MWIQTIFYILKTFLKPRVANNPVFLNSQKFEQTSPEKLKNNSVKVLSSYYSKMQIKTQ